MRKRKRDQLQGSRCPHLRARSCRRRSIAAAPTVLGWGPAIDRALAKARLHRAAAVFTVHSHYDHAMDAPRVASRLGAELIGSASTANIARGVKFPESRLRVVVPGAPMRFGAFEVVMLESGHFPHGMAMGDITEPLVPPARALAYREGGSYSILIAHPLGTLLVQASSSWVDGSLAGRHADVAFLGVAGLSTKDAAYTDAYHAETADAVGARMVVPIHWDDFTRPLNAPLVPAPRLLDDLDVTMDRITRHLGPRGVGLHSRSSAHPEPALPWRGRCRPQVAQLTIVSAGRAGFPGCDFRKSPSL